MPDKSVNLCRFTTPTVGAGNIAVGAAVVGFFTPAAAGVLNGDTVTYSIQDGARSECGRGTYGSVGPTLTRTTIFTSTAGAGTPISLSGTAQVIFTPLAENVTLSGALTLNKIPRASSATGLVDSLISDNGTTVAINVGADSNVLIGPSEISSHFNALSFNGSLADADGLTIYGGLAGNSNLYFNAPNSIGGFVYRVVGSDAARIGSGGLTLYGTTSGSLTIKPPASGTAGTVTFPSGTTDFSTTGGANRILKQNTPGGPITVATLAANNLSNGVTGSGAVVLATSPTLVSPALGTPSSGVGTNLTGTAAGLTVGNVTTNANLTGPITSVGNATTVTVGSITNAMLAGSITSAKLAGLVQADIAGLTTSSSPAFAGLDVTKIVTAANSTAAATTSTLTYNPTANSTSGLPIAAYALAQSAGIRNIFQLTGLYTYYNHGSTGTLAAGVGLFIDSNQKGGSAGAITTNYGVYVGNQTVGTTNFAIYTGSGRIHFGDGATFGNPTGGYEGIGTLNLEGSLYNNGAPPTGTGSYVRSTGATLTGATLNSPTMQTSQFIAPTDIDAYIGNITIKTGFQKGLVIKGDTNGTGLPMAPTSAPQIWLSDYSLNYLNYALQLGYYNASGRGWTGLIQAIAGASNAGADIDINPIGGNVTINRFVGSLGSPISSLGIGVYPVYPIDVRVPGTNNWIIQAGAGGPVFIRMGIDSSGSPNKGIIEIHTDPLTGSSSGALLLQRTGGNVGIGVSGDPGAMLEVGGSMKAVYFKSAPTTYAGRPGSPAEGDFCNFSDSNTVVWRATIAGGGANKVLGRYNGTNWTVVG